MRGDKVSRERHRAPNPVRFAEPQRTLRPNPRYSLFTPGADWYLDQYAAPAHKIQNFSPHPSACDPNHTCPACP